MKLTGLHLLLTYQCNFECDHCFVWGSPWQSGTMTLKDIHEILTQAEDLASIEWIYFEGGEPFLYYPILLQGVRMASQHGFNVGLVSNAYWATNIDDAIEWLKPFRELIQDLSISGDLYHESENDNLLVNNAYNAAEQLGIPVGVISIAQPETTDAKPTAGQLPVGESTVMYRGRAAEKLVSRSALNPWHEFKECPCEDLREPERVHLDPFGNLYICQGISLGNVFRTPLTKLCKRYNPDHHRITGPLLSGGPAELVRRYKLPHTDDYADACHLCYEARCTLRERFPEILNPDQMYGIFDD